MHTRRLVLVLLLASACGGDERATPPDGVLIDASTTDGAESIDGTTTDGTAIDSATDAATTDAMQGARTWSAPVLAAEQVSGPEITIDPTGVVTAVWVRFSTALVTNIEGSRLAPTAEWQSPTTLSNERSGSQDLGADAAGNVILVWTELDDVWTRRFEPATGWGTASVLDVSTWRATSPQIAVAPSGQAMVVYSHRTMDGFDLWARRYVPGAGWQAAVQLTTPPHSVAYQTVAIDPAGNAMVVWRQTVDDSQEGIWARRFTPESGWQPAVRVSDPAGGVADAPTIAMDAHGNALAMWGAAGDASDRVWARRYSSGGWSEPVRLDERARLAPGWNAPLRVAFDGAGNAIAIWGERLPDVSNVPRYAVASRRWSATGWSAATEITNDAYPFVGLQLDVNASGDAIVAWQRDSDALGDRAGVRTYTNASGWSEEMRLGTAGLESVTPQVQIAPSGDAVVVWGEHGFESPSPPRIWSAAFR